MADNDTFGMNKRKNNIKAVFEDPRKRFIALTMGVLIVGMIGYGLFSGGSSVDDQPQDTGTQAIKSPSVESRPGAVSDATYVQAVKDENAERLKEAQQTGGSFIPTPTAAADAPSLDPLADANKTPETVQQPAVNPYVAPVPTPIQEPVPSAPVAENTAPRMTTDELQKTTRYKHMEEQMTRYMNSWGQTKPMQEFKYNGQVKEVEAPVVASANNASGSASASSGNQSNQKAPAIVRAGTIIPAVMRSSLNSDAPGPVLAEIVSGPFAGARLLGTFKNTGKDLVVTFTTLSVPGEPRSFAINAVGVNDKLGTGMATDVNNHYFMKYGLKFAAGFARGYADYVTRGGTETILSDGGIIVTQDKLSPRQVNRAAAGEGISEISSDIDRASDIAPTIKAESKDGSGIPMGILFMSDF